MSHRGHRPVYADTVHIKCGVRCTEVKPNSVTVLEKDGTEIVYEADTILYAVGMKAKPRSCMNFEAHPTPAS